MFVLKWLVDRSLYNGSDFVKGYPFSGVPLDAKKHMEIHVFIGISGSPLFCSAAGFFAVTDPLPFDHMHFGTYPFILVRMPFFVTVPTVFYRQIRVFGAGGIAINIVTDFFKGAFFPGVTRNQCFREMEIIFEETISLDGVKGETTEESIRMEVGMQPKEISENRLQCRRIANGLIFIWRVIFFSTGISGCTVLSHHPLKQ